MCIDVEVRRGSDAQYCETKGELESALGGPVLPLDAEWPGDSCLCPMDEEETAKWYGFVVDRSDPFVTVFRLKDAA